MQVTEHVHALRMDYVVRVSPTMSVKRFVYVYVIVGQRVHLIDAGIAPAVGEVQAYLASIGRSLEEVATVALTHSHPDHIGGLKEIHSQSKCHVVAHPSEVPWIETTQLQADERPMREFDRLVAGDVKVDRQVQDGDRIELEPGLCLEVVHTPGHSPGSVSYLLNKGQVLFTGDAVAFTWGVPIYDDLMATVATVKRLQSLKAVDWLLSSWDEPRHGQEVSEVFERCGVSLQTIHDAVRQETRALAAVDSAALCRAVFKRLKLPAVAANPRVAQSLMSHVPFLDKIDIMC